jgi:hypothetical protein
VRASEILQEREHDMNLKPKFEWYEDNLSCGSIYLVTLKRVLPTEDEEGCELLETPVLHDALVETGILIGMREWIDKPLRLKNSSNVKAIVEELYTALFDRLQFEVSVSDCLIVQSK